VLRVRALLLSFLRVIPQADPGGLQLQQSDQIVSIPLLHDHEEFSDTTVSNPFSEITGFALFKESSFWVLFFAHLFSSGSGLLWKNIIGSVCRAFRLPELASPMVIVWSLVNTATRISMGFISDFGASRVPRPLWGLITLIIAIAGVSSYFFINQENSKSILWVIVVCSALGYGGPFTLFGGLFAIYFGTRHIGFNLGILSFAPAIGGTSFLALSKYLNNRNNQTATEGSGCQGIHCYESTIFLLLPTLLVALGLNFGLTILHFKRFHAWDRKNQ